MTPLERRIRGRIAADGPIPVAEYMATALSDPEHGYYVRRDPLGAAGDFVTAPEISQVFGELIGLWCAVAWRQMGAPGRVVLAELGPGHGTLMADALRAARVEPEFLAAVELHLVETGRVLRDRQREALAAYSPAWHDGFDEIPDGPLLLVANEFFDALPVEQYLRTETGWRRRCIGLDDASDALCFVADDGPSVDEAAIPPWLRVAPAGALCEVGPAAAALAAAIGRRLARARGAALIIDYGPAVGAPGETLQSVARQRYHGVLDDPGEADLTAHVDFRAIATAAANAGAAVHGPLPQSALLERLGIGRRLERLLGTATPGQAAELRSACRRLTDPRQMGTLFKALALTGHGMAPPPGFEDAAAA